MIENIENPRFFCILALLIATVGSIGQSYLLYHELVDTYPYKIMDYGFYSKIAFAGIIVSPLVSILLGSLWGYKNYWVALYVPVVFCPLIFATVFRIFSMAVGSNSSFEKTTPAIAAQDFYIYSISLAGVGLLFAGICHLILYYFSKAKKFA
ncbi:MAG: hypothetical protein R2681_00395 [Pyrinomonadaceae bacterium]